MSTPLSPISDPQGFSPNGPAPLTLPISPTSPQSPSSPLSASFANSGVSSPTSSLPPQAPLSPPPHGFGASKEGEPHYYEGYITRRSSVLKRWKKRKPYAIVPGRFSVMHGIVTVCVWEKHWISSIMIHPACTCMHDYLGHLVSCVSWWAYL